MRFDLNMSFRVKLIVSMPMCVNACLYLNLEWHAQMYVCIQSGGYSGFDAGGGA